MSEAPKTEKLTPEATQDAVVAKRRTPTKGKKEIEKKATALSKLIVEYVGVDALSPNTYNPNRQSEHDFELLLRSMEEDGFTQPIVVGRGNVIVDGEHRWRAAKTLGYTEIPIVRVDMDAAQARIATIRHNRARGSHDIELEASVLKDLQALGALDWAADSLMLSDEELNRMMEDISAPEALAAESFTDAWNPQAGGASEQHVTSDQASTIDFKGGTASTAMTTAAVDAQRAAEVRIAAAKSEQEKDQIRKENAVYRLSCIFTGEQGVVVKAVLGDRPTERVFQLCQAEAAKAGA